MPNPHSFVQLGVEQFQVGNLLGAEYFLYEAVKVEPNNYDANLILGLVKVAQSHSREAANFFLKALELRHNSIPAAINLAQSYWSCGNEPMAIKAYQDAITLHPNNLELLFGLATIFTQNGEVIQAQEIYKNILRLNPSAMDARLNLAAMLADSGDFCNALLVLKAASKNSKLNKTYWSNLSAIYIGLKNWQEAEKAIKKAISMDEKDPQLLIRAGEVMLTNRDPIQAKKWFEKAISFAPQSAEAWTGLGNAMIDLEQDGGAEMALSKSLELDPNNATTWCARGILFKEMGHHNKAVECLELARKFAPLMPEIANNAAHLNLGACNFLEGWRDYEARWDVKAFNSRRLFMDEKRWNGEEIDGFLLVWAEQGIGDQILYASMLEMLSRKVQNIVVILDHRLVPIFKRSMPQIAFLAMDADISSIAFEKQISLGSLGQYLLGCKAAFKERKHPYLFADQATASQLMIEQKIEGKKVCGLSWISKASKYSSNKSFSLEDLRPILEISSLTFLDVGYAETRRERESIKARQGIDIIKVDQIDSFNNIDGLAALIHSCSFVITCSNTCAHLAGALGKKTFLLVPKFRGRFWYWNDIDGTSLWYPSITIITKDANEDWFSVADRVRRLVDAL